MAQSSDISPQGNWHWNAPAKRLLIDVQRGADLSELSGDWSIDALEQMLEGLSRGRLDRAFEGGDGPVRCNLRLSSGRSVHLVGAFVGESEARGMLLSGDDFQEIDPSDLNPGPDLAPVFQPIVSLPQRRVAFYEGFTRLRRPDGSLILPAEFLDAGRRAALYDEIFALGSQAFMTGTGPELFAELGLRAQYAEVTETEGVSTLFERASP